MMISKNRQVLDEASLNLPGLVLFGHHIANKAISPLVTHVHPGCLEMVAVMKGKESYDVENQKYDLVGGDIFISYLDQPHRSGSTVQGVCEILWFQINPNSQGDFLGLAKPFGDLIRSRLLDLATHRLKTDRDGLFFLKKSFDSFLKQKAENRLLAQSMLISFLSRLLFEQNRSPRDDELIRRVLQYIDDHLEQVIKIEDICLTFQLSPSGFKHKFKEGTGVTPRDYINSRKIQKAKDLLQSGKTVTETAMQLSFNSSDYFSVVFKKYTACSPTQFVRGL